MSSEGEPPLPHTQAVDAALGLRRDGFPINPNDQDQISDEALLETFRIAADIEKHIRSRRQELADAARARSISWIALGAAAGMNRQSAQRRWDPVAREKWAARTRRITRRSSEEN